MWIRSKMQCSCMCPRRRKIARCRTLKCRCVNLLLFVTIFGTLGYAGFNLYERYVIKNALESMKLTLESMKKTVARTGNAYDELHQELDKMTRQAIPTPYILEEETNEAYKAAPKILTDSATQFERTSFQDNTAQATKRKLPYNKIAPAPKHKKSSKNHPLENKNNNVVPSSSECKNRCLFLPIGEYCGKEKCINKDVMLQNGVLRELEDEGKDNENQFNTEKPYSSWKTKCKCDAVKNTGISSDSGECCCCHP